MIEDSISLLMGVPEYEIGGYMICGDEVIVFIRDITDAQSRIPKTIDGKTLRIFKSI